MLARIGSTEKSIATDLQVRHTAILSGIYKGREGHSKHSTILKLLHELPDKQNTVDLDCWLMKFDHNLGIRIPSREGSIEMMEVRVLTKTGSGSVFVGREPNVGFSVNGLLREKRFRLFRSELENT